MAGEVSEIAQWDRGDGVLQSVQHFLHSVEAPPRVGL